jgi:hypothetical protein
MFECYERFATRSKDNREAFYWLLDNHDAWTSPQAGPSAQVRERLVLLNDARRMMLTYLFEILANGYQLAELLLGEAASVWTLKPFEDFERVLRSLRAVDAKGIRWRRAFYAARNRSALFDEDCPMALVRWNDQVAREEPDAHVEILVAAGANGAATRLRLPAMTEVALPVGTIPPQDACVVRKLRLDENRPVARAIALTRTHDLIAGARDITLFPS